MLKLKLQYLGHLMQRANSLEKTLMLGKIEGRRRGHDRGWGGWMALPTPWTWVWASSGRRWRTGKPGVLQCMGLQRVRHDQGTEQQQWSRQNEIERQEFLMSHPRTQVDTLKKTVLKIASPCKIFVVQGGNGIKMVLLPVHHFTTCFHGNWDETAELGSQLRLWGLGNGSLGHSPYTTQAFKRNSEGGQTAVSVPCGLSLSACPRNRVLGLCWTQDIVPRCTTCGRLNIQTCKKPFLDWFSCMIPMCFLNLNAMLILLKDLL